ncbi:MAG TPA: nucleotidyltransferase domain-containing protein [Nitrospiraceae bacterium]|nr:nucleotidyltransferase domain-containing protein [Nitrospiraceae bacterium]
MSLSQPLPDALKDLAGRYGIQLLLQFGSTVSGPVHSRSDLDLAVLLNNADVSLDRLGEIQQSLQSCFPGRDLDLAIINRADPLFIKKVFERCRLLYGSAKDLQRLRLYAFKRYQDHRRFLALERRYVERALTRLEAER